MSSVFLTETAVLGVLQDPVEITRDTRVNTRIARPGTAVAPRHNSCKRNWDKQGNKLASENLKSEYIPMSSYFLSGFSATSGPPLSP